MSDSFRCEKSQVTVIYRDLPPNDRVLQFDAWPFVHFGLYPDELFAALEHFGIRGTRASTPTEVSQAILKAALKANASADELYGALDSLTEKPNA